MLRFWNHVVSISDDRLPKVIYKHLQQQQKSWIKNIEGVFMMINCSDIFKNDVPIVNLKEFLLYAKECLMSKQKSAWLKSVQVKPKLHYYALYKFEYETENYCTVNLSRQQRSLIARLRLGILPINVEIGRYTGIPRENRYCINCEGIVEDELHVMLYCPLYETPRQKLLREAANLCNGFYVLSDVYKIEFLTTQVNIVRKSASFINQALCIRQQVMRV